MAGKPPRGSAAIAARTATRENTTANFAEVLGMGVDYIEIDVQLTRDRQAVIFHDMALEERTPLHGISAITRSPS